MSKLDEWEKVEGKDLKVGDKVKIFLNDQNYWDRYTGQIIELNNSTVYVGYWTRDGISVLTSTQPYQRHWYGNQSYNWRRLVDELQYDPSQQLDLEEDI